MSLTLERRVGRQLRRQRKRRCGSPPKKICAVPHIVAAPRGKRAAQAAVLVLLPAKENFPSLQMNCIFRGVVWRELVPGYHEA